MKRFLLFFLLLGVFGVKAQLSLSVNLSVSDTVSLTGNPFFYNVNFAITSANLPGENVILRDTLPQYVIFKGIVNSSLVANTTYDKTTRVVTINLINPLPAGTTGNVQLNCAFQKWVTPTNLRTLNKVYISASNSISSSVVSNTASIISKAFSNYNIRKEIIAYDAIQKIITWKILVDNRSCCWDTIGVLGLSKMYIEDSIPLGAFFVSASHGGYEFIPNSRKIVWDLYNYPFGWCFGPTGERTITIKYPTIPYGEKIQNTASLKGILPDGSLFESNASQNYQILEPVIGAGCTDKKNNSGFVNLGLVGLEDVRNAGLFFFSNSGNVPLPNFEFELIIPDQIKLGDYMCVKDIVKRFFITTNTDPTNKILISGYKWFNNQPGESRFDFPVFPLGTYIKKVILEFDTLPAGFESSVQLYPFQILKKDRNGDEVKPTKPYLPQLPCDGIGTCISFESVVRYTYNSGVISSNCVYSIMPKANFPNVYNVQKYVQNQHLFVPEDTIEFKLRIDNNGDEIINPVFTDTLIQELEFIPNSWSSITTLLGEFEPVQLYPKFTKSGQSLKFEFIGDSNKLGYYCEINFKAIIKKNVSSGIYYNRFYFRADNIPYPLLNGNTDNSQTLFSVNSVVSITANKGVKGEIDSTYLFYPTNATTINGSEVSYKLRINNTGNTKLKDLVLVDALPYKGDARGSEFTPFMTSLPTSNQSNLAIYYSLDSTICINEISPPISPFGCIVPTWTTVAPVDLKKVKALKFLFLDSLKGGDSLNVTWNMSAPSDLKQNQVAYNDFHYQARKADDNTLLLTTSPNKVGVIISNLAQVGQYVWLDRNKNGIQDEDKKEGLNGMVVQLWKPGADNKPNTSDDIFVDDTLTANNVSGEPGYYRFTTLPDRYFLKFKVDTCRYHKTTSFDYVTGVFSLLPAQLKFDMNLGLVQDTISVSGNTQACLGSSVVLESKLESDYTNPNFLWQKSDDNGISWKDLAGQNQAKFLISTIAEVDSGLYRVLASENGRIQTNCRIVSDTIRLKVSNSLVKPIYPDTTICAGDKVILNKTIPAASGSYYWYKTPKGGIPIANNFVPSISSNTSFYLADSIAGGCKSERVEVKINVQPKPKDPLFSIESICFGEQVVLNKTTPATSGSYYWFKTSTGGNPIPNNFTTPVLTSNTTYYLIDSISGGCKSSRIPVTILVKDCPKDSVVDQTKEIFFPNGFSPNEDGISDFYTVFNIPEGVKVSVWFFNRWGDLVFKNENYQNNWEGKCETNLCLGEKLPSGTYFLHAILSNGNKFKTNVTLIR